MRHAASNHPPQTIRLSVQVVPHARRTEVVGLHGDALKVRLQAQPIGGKANAALIHVVANALGLPTTAVRLTHGHTAKRKVLEVTVQDMTHDALWQALLTGVSAP